MPEVIHTGYEVGHVDFTPEGYALHREVIRAIHGVEFLERSDAGFNLDEGECQFDVYSVNVKDCRTLMETIESDGAAYAGAERIEFIERDEPTPIAQWRPNRFVLRETGYHGVLRFRRLE